MRKELWHLNQLAALAADVPHRSRSVRKKYSMRVVVPNKKVSFLRDNPKERFSEGNIGSTHCRPVVSNFSRVLFHPPPVSKSTSFLRTSL